MVSPTLLEGRVPNPYDPPDTVETPAPEAMSKAPVGV